MPADPPGRFGTLGRRPRRLGDEAERARKAVSARIHNALDRIEQQHSSLARHLSDAITSGTICVYEPRTPTRWAL